LSRAIAQEDEPASGINADLHIVAIRRERQQH